MVPVIEMTPLAQLNRARRTRRSSFDHDYKVTTTALERIRLGVEFWYLNPSTSPRFARLLEAELKHLDQYLRYA